MPRPRREKVIIFTIKFWLIPGRDDDIIQYMQTIPPRQRAASVLQAMRGGLTNQPHPIDEETEANAILDSMSDLWS
jgi:hypothetical protein